MKTPPPSHVQHRTFTRNTHQHRHAEEENMFGKAKKSVVLSKCEWYEQSSQKLYRDHVLV